MLLWSESLSSTDIWSPYYRISVSKAGDGYAINVNGIPHQNIIPARQLQKVYSQPYLDAPGNPLNDVLIIGAGTGDDVANALLKGAKHIDAVEIDPELYQLGKRLNPDHPYQNPRVTVHINDGRAFLEQTHTKYDMILFALPDSLTLVAGQSSLRLESYLFTLQAVEAAKAHLNPATACSPCTTTTGRRGFATGWRTRWRWPSGTPPAPITRASRCPCSRTPSTRPPCTAAASGSARRTSSRLPPTTTRSSTWTAARSPGSTG